MKNALLVLMLCAAGLTSAEAATNLLANGSFDSADSSLANWKYKYDKEGESWYFTNHERVKVVEKEEGRSNVLSLFGDSNILTGTGQGTKVDSYPVQVKPGGRYKLTLTARSTGPCVRAMVEGYQWRPGVKPHPSPELAELRKVFKSELVYFGSQKGGSVSSPGKSWQTDSVTFPGEKPTELAADKLSKMEFLVVHIIAINGSAGNLYIDDVKLEQVK